MTVDRQQIIDQFNRAHATYDHYAVAQVKMAQTLAFFLRQLTLQHPRSILEIGCGTGIFTQLLLRHFPSTPLLLTDLAPNMVFHCQRRFSSFSQITCRIANGETVTALQPFDLLVSNATFQWFSSPLHHIERLLLQSQRLLFSLLLDGSFSHWKQLCKEHQLTTDWLPLISQKELTVFLQQLRGVKTTIEIIPLSVLYPTVRDFLSHFKAIGATYSSPFQRSTDLRPLLKQRIEADYLVAYCLLEQ